MDPRRGRRLPVQRVRIGGLDMVSIARFYAVIIPGVRVKPRIHIRRRIVGTAQYRIIFYDRPVCPIRRSLEAVGSLRGIQVIPHLQGNGTVGSGGGGQGGCGRLGVRGFQVGLESPYRWFQLPSACAPRWGQTGERFACFRGAVVNLGPPSHTSYVSASTALQEKSMVSVVPVFRRADQTGAAG